MSAIARNRMKNWEVIADNLSKAGWSWGCISSTDHEGRQFWVVAAERENAGRFIVQADEKLTAFMELESLLQPFVRDRTSCQRLREADSRFS